MIGAVDLQQLAYFRSAARLQHLTRAAEEQGIAQPSLSKSLRLLESELGVQLFDRKGRGVRLNSFGRAYLRHVDAVFRSLEDGRRELEDLASTRQEEIAVAAVALFWATGLFKAFSAQRPDVRFRLYQRTPVEMFRQLARREVDLCLITDPDDSAFEWIPLAQGDVWVMVPPGHRLEGRRTVALGEIRGEPTILPRHGGPLRAVVDELYREAGMELNVVCESDDASAMRGLVVAGMGIQFVPDFRRALEREADPLTMRLVDPERTIELGFAQNREGYRTRAAEEFVAFAVEFIKSGLPLPRA